MSSGGADPIHCIPQYSLSEDIVFPQTRLFEEMNQRPQEVHLFTPFIPYSRIYEQRKLFQINYKKNCSQGNINFEQKILSPASF
jgi:hypothetical protein